MENLAEESQYSDGKEMRERFFGQESEVLDEKSRSKVAQLYDLLFKLISEDPESRPEARDALTHPVFSTEE